MEKKKSKKQTVKSVSKGKSETKNLARARGISTRGRIFRGIVIRKFPKRVTIEFERTVKIPKYERFMKKKTKIHARLPYEMHDEIHIGDLIRVQECRPLSKITHFIVIEKIKSKGEENGNGGKGK
ncbi:MAG: 30S ribosomal protein S17 [Nanoarchaeota archaeon]